MAIVNQKVLVVFNPKAGKEDQADQIRAALTQHLTPRRWTPAIYETTGEKGEDVAVLCRSKCS